MMPYSNLNATLSASDLNNLQTSLTNIKTILPFLINLTPLERKKMGSYLGKHDLFTQKAFEIATANPILVPLNLDMVGWKSDIDLYENIISFTRQVGQLMEGLNDTLAALKVEKTKTASLFYKILNVQKDSNIPGIDAMIETMKASMPKVGRKKQVKAKAID